MFEYNFKNIRLVLKNLYYIASTVGSCFTCFCVWNGWQATANNDKSRKTNIDKMVLFMLVSLEYIAFYLLGFGNTYNKINDTKRILAAILPKSSFLIAILW